MELAGVDGIYFDLRLDVLNLYAGWLGNTSFVPTMEFFNRHAGRKDPATAKAAFLSFRDSLDTADTLRFPVAQFGPVDDPENPTQFANGERMMKIVETFSDHGARLGQLRDASSKNSVHQKKANELIDVLAAPRRQLPAASSSTRPVKHRWWQLGPVNESFGRFARGLEHATGKPRHTELDHNFAVAAEGQTALVHLVFYDQGLGRWALGYGGKHVLVVRKQDMRGGKAWRSASVNVTLQTAVPPQLTLSSLDAEDDIFSMIEVVL